MAHVSALKRLWVASALTIPLFSAPAATLAAGDKDIQNDFLAAVWAGDVAAAGRYLSIGADPHAPDQSGMNALHIAEALKDNAMIGALTDARDMQSTPTEGTPDVAHLTPTPFDLRFRPATGRGDRISHVIRLPDHRTLTTILADKKRRRTEEPDVTIPADSSSTTATIDPLPLETSNKTQKSAARESFFDWFLGIFKSPFEPGSTTFGAERGLAARSSSPGQGDGQPPITTMTVEAPGETSGDGEKKRVSQDDARNDDEGGTWIASIFRTLFSPQTGTEAVTQTAPSTAGSAKRNSDARVVTATKQTKSEPAITSEPLSSGWTTVATRRGRQDGDILDTPAYALSDLTAKTDVPRSVDHAVTAEVAQPAKETKPASTDPDGLTFADLFNALSPAGEQTTQTDPAEGLLEASPEISAGEPSPQVAAVPIDETAQTTGLIAETDPPTETKIIGRLYSDPYGGALPAGAAVPVYDDGQTEAQDADAVAPAIALARNRALQSLQAETTSDDASGTQQVDEDKGLVIYIRGTVPAENLYLGDEQHLGRAYGSDSDPATACATRRGGVTWVCPEATSWPAEISRAFVPAKDGLIEALVRYDGAEASHYRASFPTANYDQLLAYFQSRLGAPTRNPEVWSPIVGAAKEENRVALWVAREEDERGRAILEIRSIDDLRWMAPPDPENGVVRLFYEGAKPIYSLVTNADLRLLEVRRMTATNTAKIGESATPAPVLQ